jgi:hypothetical protein
MTFASGRWKSNALFRRRRRWRRQQYCMILDDLDPIFLFLSHFFHSQSLHLCQPTFLFRLPLKETQTTNKFMMKFASSTILVALSMTAVVVVRAETADRCAVPGTLTCFPISASGDDATSVARVGVTKPTLDGDLSDWASVQGGITTPIRSIFGKNYLTEEDGEDIMATYKCLYDDQNIYFSLEVPGRYRFDELDNKKCAAIGTMTRIGSKAAYLNMGSCPEALQGCEAGPNMTECADYLVDLGAHWELRTTQMNVPYPFNT